MRKAKQDMPAPPLWVDYWLERILPPEILEDVQGDLHEVFYQNLARQGVYHARSAYLQAALPYLNPYFLNRKTKSYPKPLLSDMLKNYFTVSLRNLRRNPLYSLLNLTGLAVGLSASMLILLWVQNEFSFDAYHQQADRTYRVTNTLHVSEQPWVWANSPQPLGETAKRHLPAIKQFTLFKKAWQPVFRIGNQLLREEKAVFVDSTWFAVFDYKFLLGDPNRVFEQPNSIILTEKKARDWFKDPTQAIGKIVQMDSTSLIVRAVIGDNPVQSSFRYEVLLPIALSLPTARVRTNDQSWDQFNYQLFLQLEEGANPNKVGQQLTQLYYTHKKDSSVTASLIPLREIHFTNTFQTDDLPKGNRQAVITLGVVGLLILIIASINYVNLSTALASQRAKEIGIKKIIGAGRLSLFGQFLSESALLCLLALVLALGLIALMLPWFNEFTGNAFTLDLGNSTLWLLLLGSLGLTMLLSGIYPSLLLSSFEPVKALKGGNLLNTRNAGFRQGLVVLQFATSTVLIVSTLVIYRQLHYVQTKDPGYQREHVFSFQLPSTGGAQTKNARDYIKQRLSQVPGVSGITSTNQSIIDMKSSHSGSLKWEGKPESFNPTVAQFSVEPETRSVFGLHLSEGRWFERERGLDTANVILSETAVKALGLKYPVVGQWFEFTGRRGQIIGVVKDFHFRSFHQKIEPIVLCYNPGWQSVVSVKINPGMVHQVLVKAERIWQEGFPDTPFVYSFLEESFEQLHQKEKKVSQLFNVFAAIAVFISCLGLFGLATFSAERRVKEIGIRKVLGASVSSIVTLLSKDFLKLVLLAIGLACPVAGYVLQQWLQEFAYKISLEWWVFALAGLLAMTIALLTVSFQSIKAALINPAQGLRTE